MKLYVPDIGDKITLSADWTFKLYQESRNMAFLKKQNLPSNYNRDAYHNFTLPTGTELIVDRIYIRKGSGFEDFSSLTFRITNGNFKGRFWAKLADVNEIEYATTGLAKRIMQVKLASASDISQSTYFHYYHSNKNQDKANLKELESMVGKSFSIRRSGRHNDSIMDEIGSFRYQPIFILEDLNKQKVIDKKLKIKYRRTIDKIVPSPDNGKMSTGAFFRSALIDEKNHSHTIHVTNTYELYDEEQLLGSWKSAESLIKKAKQYFNDLMKDPAYKRNETTADFFN